MPLTTYNYKGKELMANPHTLRLDIQYVRCGTRNQESSQENKTKADNIILVPNTPDSWRTFASDIVAGFFGDSPYRLPIR